MSVLLRRAALRHLRRRPWQALLSVAGITLGATAALGGAVAVRYLRVARETVRALRVRSST